jgi:tetrahydromethanopterin S-methyltransferase subunit B
MATERTYTAKQTAKITAYAAMVVLVQSETTRTTTSASTVAGTASTPLSDANATPNSTPTPKGGGGLSAGAKAGIAIGIVLGVVFMAVAAFLLFRRRRKKQSGVKAEESKSETDRSHGIFDWMRSNEAAAAEHSAAGATSPSELDGTTDPRHSRGVSTVMSETTAWSDGKRLSELHGTSTIATPNLHESINEMPVEMGGSRGQR